MTVVCIRFMERLVSGWGDGSGHGSGCKRLSEEGSEDTKGTGLGER